MRSTLMLAVLVAGSLALSLVAIFAVSGEQWVLAGVAFAVVLNLILVVALDSWRRVRQMRRFVRQEVRRLAVTESKEIPGPTVADVDVVGSVRLMQAQYVGRLDRMQASLTRQ
ncbi:hypothetical protein [Ornithinimicrobium sp. INDO-MA30-4]|uniref:hypothetical protein n=1 Tax=Ornithinimicrobium sp. INDO-MA30-4 TaxID=2908651 RepID=UPI001F4359D9|nr:hypothetical protein [Ornithinimicrobium sp. INDO-MA30-4]UJH70087.1 hypothetical protein L0A91_12905 [Ornithinimicrobium sp. INDO-MA30-4]